MFTPFHKELLTQLKASYPNLRKEAFSLEPYLPVFSPYTLSLKSSLLAKIQSFISDYDQIIHSKKFIQSYKDHLSAHEKKILDKKKSQGSLLTSFDFHVSSAENQFSLIEVNTNASGFLILDSLYKLHKINNPYHSLDLLKQSFEKEGLLSDQKHSVAIIDETITQQKNYIEFLMYQDLIQSWGHECELVNFEQLHFTDNRLHANNISFDFIYNRYCDFLLEEPRSKELLQAYLQDGNSSTLSPHPKAYLLKAHKQRLIDLSAFLEKESENDFKTLKSGLLKTIDLSQEIDKDQLWTNRKKFFFKLKSSFGGKSAYRGKNITKKVFDRILDQPALAQELAPPEKITPYNSSEEYKYDLRFFAYQGKILLIGARLFQGQVMGFGPYGTGFAPIVIE